MTHTQGELRYSLGVDRAYGADIAVHEVVSSDGKIIATCPTEADARRIVLSLNTHPALLAALIRARNAIPCMGRFADTNDVCGVTFTCPNCHERQAIDAAIAATKGGG